MPKYNPGRSARILLDSVHLYNVTFSQVFCELVKISDRRNLVYLNSHRKKHISSVCKVAGLDRMLNYYVKNGTMIRIAESTYFLNPFIVVKCTNKEVFALQDEYTRLNDALAVNRKRRRFTKIIGVISA
jgi:hypothetical protein